MLSSSDSLACSRGAKPRRSVTDTGCTRRLSSAKMPMTQSTRRSRIAIQSSDSIDDGYIPTPPALGQLAPRAQQHAVVADGAALLAARGRAGPYCLLSFAQNLESARQHRRAMDRAGEVQVDDGRRQQLALARRRRGEAHE